MMASTDLSVLEHKLDTLLDMYRRVERENKVLRAERSRLLQDNELARSKVDNVMQKLQQLEGKFDGSNER